MIQEQTQNYLTQPRAAHYRAIAQRKLARRLVSRAQVVACADEAQALYTRASQLGSSSAHYAMASALEEGSATLAPNLAQAWAHYAKAAQLGNVQAQRKLQQLQHLRSKSNRLAIASFGGWVAVCVVGVALTGGGFAGYAFTALAFTGIAVLTNELRKDSYV